MGGRGRARTFALYRALLLVHEGSRLVGASGELDEVQAGGFEAEDGVLRLIGGESSVAEIGRVDLDGQDELLVWQGEWFVSTASREKGKGRTRDASANRSDDFEEDARAVLVRAAVLVRSLVNARREELREKVAVSAMQLDTIGASLQQRGFSSHSRSERATHVVKNSSSESEARRELFDLSNGHRPRLVELLGSESISTRILRRHKQARRTIPPMGAVWMSDDETGTSAISLVVCLPACVT